MTSVITHHSKRMLSLVDKFSDCCCSGQLGDALTHLLGFVHKEAVNTVPAIIHREGVWGVKSKADGFITILVRLKVGEDVGG
jgi:hypothetical protein